MSRKTARRRRFLREKGLPRQKLPKVAHPIEKLKVSISGK
jgi:hypothetical protein